MNKQTQWRPTKTVMGYTYTLDGSFATEAEAIAAQEELEEGIRETSKVDQREVTYDDGTTEERWLLLLKINMDWLHTYQKV